MKLSEYCEYNIIEENLYIINNKQINKYKNNKFKNYLKFISCVKYEEEKENKNFEISLKFIEKYLLDEKIIDNILKINKNIDLIHPNIYFDNIYVINLKDDIKNKERIEKIFSKYNIKCNFFEAINGYTEENLKLYNKTKLKSPGVYGYILSMISILEDAKSKNYKKILVCDDDIILHKNFDIKFDESIKTIPYSWKVLFFGLSGPWFFNGNTFLSSFDFNINYIINLKHCDGSFCVGYDIEIYDIFIDIVKKFELAFDTEIIKYLNLNINIERYAFYPPIVITDTLKKSKILNYNGENNLIKNFERNHLKFLINLNQFELDTMENNGYKNLKIF